MFLHRPENDTQFPLSLPPQLILSSSTTNPPAKFLFPLHSDIHSLYLEHSSLHNLHVSFRLWIDYNLLKS